MRSALPAFAVLVLLSAPAAVAQSRRVVAVCPSVVAADVDPKVAASVDAWVHDALVSRKIARVDPALMKSEIAIFDDKKCPTDEKARIDFGRSLRATDVLVVRVFYPSVIAGTLSAVDGKPHPALPVIRPDAAKPVTQRSAREAVNAFIAALPITPGEELIAPLVDPVKPPENAAVVTPTPPDPPAPAKREFRLGGPTVGAYAVGVVAAAAGATTFWFAGNADRRFDELNRSTNRPGDEVQLAALQSEGTTLRTIGSVALGAGAAAFVVGTVLGFTAAPPPEKPAVSLSVTPGAVSIAGTF